MRLIRPCVAMTVGLSLVIAGSAGAAKKPPPVKPVCNLVTDPSGDANLDPATGKNAVGPSVPAYDITSVDVANNATTFTGVLRVLTLAKKDNYAPTGIHWTVDFTVGDTQYLLSATEAVVGTSGAELDYISDVKNNLYTKIADATAVFDTTANEVRLSVPVTAIKEKLTPGVTLVTALGATAGRSYAVPGPPSDVAPPFVVKGDSATAQDASDVATGTLTYKAGAKSCVTPGK